MGFKKKLGKRIRRATNAASLKHSQQERKKNVVLNEFAQRMAQLNEKMSAWNSTVSAIEQRLTKVKASLETQRASLTPPCTEDEKNRVLYLRRNIARLHNALELLKAQGEPKLVDESGLVGSGPEQQSVPSEGVGQTEGANPENKEEP